jgi:hypothetical protein
MDDFTALMFFVFALQAIYIVYLQGKISEFKRRTVFLQDVIEDVIDDRVEVVRINKGFKVISKESEYGSR